MYLYKCQFGDNKYNNNKGGRKILDLYVTSVKTMQLFIAILVPNCHLLIKKQQLQFVINSFYLVLMIKNGWKNETMID